jgi:hypothetical protein
MMRLGIFGPAARGGGGAGAGSAEGGGSALAGAVGRTEPLFFLEPLASLGFGLGLPRDSSRFVDT